jgi:hypothetical protein
MMCAYCNCGDQFSRWDPPEWDWHKRHPLIPLPVTPFPTQPWPVEKAREYLEILKQIKELEDKLGCPCEPNKADYIKLLHGKIAELESGTP